MNSRLKYRRKYRSLGKMGKTDLHVPHSLRCHSLKKRESDDSGYFEWTILGLMLSPHRTQFHLARCLARSKHERSTRQKQTPCAFLSQGPAAKEMMRLLLDCGCASAGRLLSVGTLSKFNRAFTVPHVRPVYRVQNWNSAFKINVPI